MVAMIQSSLFTRIKAHAAVPFALLLLASAPSFAQDLESLLEDGASSEKAAPAQLKNTGLSAVVSKILRKPTSEQQIFLRYVEASEWDKATLQFLRAFEGTEFQRSANGRALFGLVQFRAGLPVTGLEYLFRVQKPKEIHAELRSAWKETAKETHAVWKVAKVNPTEAWDDVFVDQLGFKLKLQSGASDAKISELQNWSKEAVSNTPEKALIDWHLALALSLNDQADVAAKTLAGIMKSNQAPASQDLMQLTAARLLFQNGYFDAAIKYYEKVSKKSEYWPEAQEEIAWSYIRKGEPQNALAVSKSLTLPAMAPLVSSESYFIQALAQLKVCDYTGVAESLTQFPQRFKSRTQTLTELAKTGRSESVDRAFAQLKKNKIQIQQLGRDALNLPRLTVRDQRLFDFLQAQALLQAESKAAEIMYSKSLALTGLQAYFENLKATSLIRAEEAQATAVNRVKELAKTEVEETQEILRKLHIVEAELIQQVSLAERVALQTKDQKANVKTGTTGAKGRDVLTFKAENEIWFDEVSNYKIDLKNGCQGKKTL
jgi:tetratricopeptide (TPR) repeat protein